MSTAKGASIRSVVRNVIMIISSVFCFCEPPEKRANCVFSIFLFLYFRGDTCVLPLLLLSHGSKRTSAAFKETAEHLVEFEPEHLYRYEKSLKGADDDVTDNNYCDVSYT